MAAKWCALWDSLPLREVVRDMVVDSDGWLMTDYEQAMENVDVVELRIMRAIFDEVATKIYVKIEHDKVVMRVNQLITFPDGAIGIDVIDSFCKQVGVAIERLDPGNAVCLWRQDYHLVDNVEGRLSEGVAVNATYYVTGGMFEDVVTLMNRFTILRMANVMNTDET